MKKLTTFIILLSALLFTACTQEAEFTESPDTTTDIVEEQTDGYGVYYDKSEEITADNISEACTLLEEAGLSNIDTFEKWVKDYATDENHEKDPDGGMVVMLVAGDAISCDKFADYAYGVLNPVLGVIEDNKYFKVLKDKVDTMITVYGEVDAPNGDISNALPGRWKDYDITFNNDKCSIINVVYSTAEKDEAFVGYTGLLINTDNAETPYVFIEKVDFEEPYLITKLQNKEELINLFSVRMNFTVEEGYPMPLIYENDKLIGEYKLSNN